MSSPSQRIHVSCEADLQDAVMSAWQAAKSAGFSANRQLAIATCASELATNIIKYAGRGWIQLTSQEESLILLAEDKGPGIPNVELAMRDHFSTSGTLGLGLPGARRMADAFEIETASEKGTKVTARFFLAGKEPAKTCREHDIPPPLSSLLPFPSATSSMSLESSAGTLETASYRRPVAGHAHCGDRALVRKENNIVLLALVDGLGHGDHAAEIASIAIQALEHRVNCATSTGEILRSVHEVLYETHSGAAVGITRVDISTGEAVAAGIGNVAMNRFARLPGSKDTRLLSTDGVLGQRWRTPRETRILLADMDLLFMASDGLPSHSFPAEMPALRHDKPSLLAPEIVERFGKLHDDACCLLARWHS